jgi:hypothetical protein
VFNTRPSNANLGCFDSSNLQIRIRPTPNDSELKSTIETTENKGCLSKSLEQSVAKFHVVGIGRNDIESDRKAAMVHC